VSSQAADHDAALGRGAIDFKLDFPCRPNTQGERVKITMSGKYLPYQTYRTRALAPV
jgi:cyanate lyase